MEAAFVLLRTWEKGRKQVQGIETVLGYQMGRRSSQKKKNRKKNENGGDEKKKTIALRMGSKRKDLVIGPLGAGLSQTGQPIGWAVLLYQKFGLKDR